MEEMTAFFNYLPKGSKEDEAILFWTSTVTKKKGNGHELICRKFCIAIRKKSKQKDGSNWKLKHYLETYLATYGEKTQVDKGLKRSSWAQYEQEDKMISLQH